MTHVVLMTINPAVDLARERPVERQRAVARAALEQCAEFAGAPIEGWRQDQLDRPVPNDGFHWSIAHKRACVATAISDEPVGVDVEWVKPRTAAHFDEIAAANEWSIVGGRTEVNFFRLWTAKEAVVKRIGVGMAGWDDCRVIDRIDERRNRLSYRNSEFVIHYFEHAGHVAAVAGTDAVSWHVSTAQAGQSVDPAIHHAGSR